MLYHVIKGVCPTATYTNSGLVDLNKLINDVIHDEARNDTISITIGREYKNNFIVLTSKMDQLDEIQNTAHDFHIHHVRVDSTTPLERIHFGSRVMGMTYNTFDRIMQLCNSNKEKNRELFPEGTRILMAAPHKEIRNIIDYLRNNKLKTSIYDVHDNNNLLQLWTNQHQIEYDVSHVTRPKN